MKEQQKRKIHQFHTEIEDGIDLRRYPPKSSIKSHISNTLAKNNASWVSSLILSYSFLISSYITHSSNMWFSEAEAWLLFESGHSSTAFWQTDDSLRSFWQLDKGCAAEWNQLYEYLFVAKWQPVNEGGLPWDKFLNFSWLGSKKKLSDQ